MSTTTAGISSSPPDRRAGAVHVPLGDYMYRVYSSDKHSRVERGIYRLIGVNPAAEQSWGVYARSVLAFSAVSILFLYVFQRVQDKLWLSLGFPRRVTRRWPGTPRSASSPTPTGSRTRASPRMGHLVQMAGLAVQNFVSAAVGIAVAVALVRGFARGSTDELGNFWVDLVRSTCGSCCRSRWSARSCSSPAAWSRTFQLRDRRQHPGRRHAAHHRRPGRQPGGHQGARHQRRRLLQRQLRAPVREPDHVDQLARDLPAPAHPVLPAPHLRPDGRQQPAGLRDRSP